MGRGGRGEEEERVSRGRNLWRLFTTFVVPWKENFHGGKRHFRGIVAIVASRNGQGTGKNVSRYWKTNLVVTFSR